MNLEKTFYKKNRHLKKMVLVAAVGIGSYLLVGCCSEDGSRTIHPDRGAVKITTDWSASSAEAVLPDVYLLRIGSDEQSATAKTVVFKQLFFPGQQQVLAYNRPEGMSIVGQLARVDTKSQGVLNEMPGYLFSGEKSFQVVADDTVLVSVPMVQRVHQLKLTLKIVNGQLADIAQTQATISGIASEVNLITGELVASSGQQIVPTFIPTMVTETREVGTPALITTVRLLGGVPQKKQVLTLFLTLANGETQTFVTDLSADLLDLGDVQKPLELSAIIELPKEPGATGIITDWVRTDNGNIDVH